MDQSLKDSVYWGIPIFLLVLFSALVYLLWDAEFIPTISGDSLIILILVVLLVSFPLTISIVNGKKIIQKEHSKKILYKMPLYALCWSVILGIISLFIIPAGKEGYVILGFMIITAVIIFFNVFFSFLLAVYYYVTNGKSQIGKIVSYSVMGLIILELIYIIFLFLTLPFTLLCGSDVQCYAAEAIENNNPEICKQYRSGINIMECTAQYALAKNDYSLCKEYAECYTFIALKQKDISRCDLIKEMDKREQCYLEYSVTTKDLSNCDKIQDEEKRGQCFTQYGLH